MSSLRCIVQRVRVHALLGVTLTMSAFAHAASQAGPTSVILVRHAEKAAVAGDDPPISELGHERGRALANALIASPPTAIVVSSRIRTAETAGDIAKATGVTPQLISLDGGGAAHIAAVAAAVRQAHGVVLVVGHSNTIPAVIKALGGPTLPDICDATYSLLFVLTPSRDNKPATLVISRYGASEPPPPTTCQAMMPK